MQNFQHAAVVISSSPWCNYRSLWTSCRNLRDVESRKGRRFKSPRSKGSVALAVLGCAYNSTKADGAKNQSILPPEEAASASAVQDPVPDPFTRERFLGPIYNMEAFTGVKRKYGDEDSLFAWLSKTVRAMKAKQKEGRETPSDGSSTAFDKMVAAGSLTSLGNGRLQPHTQDPLITLEPITEQRPVARLAHGLDRVLFNPGVHWVQDPRSGVYNFSPWLESIPDVSDFAFERVKPFIKSSVDKELKDLMKRERRPFGGSTSSLSGILSHLYFLISEDKEVDTTYLSKSFPSSTGTFTPGQRAPVAVQLTYEDGGYRIDSAPVVEKSDKNILVWVGHLLENFLTLPPEEFKLLLWQARKPKRKNQDTRRDAYRYSKSAKFVIRSQLDAQDTRLPGTGVFDIKTRATLPIRLDLLNYQENAGYEIRRLQGGFESFEREYYDMTRSAFLKYSFQARMGDMDGVIVAYHNTERIFGFQYVPLEEMDKRLFQEESGAGVFWMCMKLMENVVQEIVNVFPKRSVSAIFEKSKQEDMLRIWVQPSDWEDDEPVPIVQLVVNIKRFYGPSKKGPPKLDMIHWSIWRSTEDRSELIQRLDKTKARAVFAYNFPSGVQSMEEMKTYWKTLRFGEKPASTSVFQDEEAESSDFNPGFFRPPKSGIRSLRRLARRGRMRRLRVMEREGEKTKIVWNQPDTAAGSLITDKGPKGPTRSASDGNDQHNGSPRTSRHQMLGGGGRHKAGAQQEARRQRRQPAPHTSTTLSQDLEKLLAGAVEDEMLESPDSCRPSSPDSPGDTKSASSSPSERNRVGHLAARLAARQVNADTRDNTDNSGNKP